MTSEQKSAGLWPWLVIFIGLAFLGITTWSIWQAAHGTSSITDPDYYSHGLKYNRTMVEARAAETMGWSMHSELAGHHLNIVLANDGNSAISGCRGELIIYIAGNSGISQRLTLAVLEEESGVYSLDLPDELSGSLTADLLLQREGARFNRRLLINL